MMQNVKRCIEKNLNALGTNRQTINLAMASVDEGYNTSYRLLQSEEAKPSSPPLAIPDELFDVIVRFSSQKRRKLAAFTIVKNEPFFLPLWCAYYVQVVGEANTYIIDNSSTDDTMERIKERWPLINVISVPSKEAFNWGWSTEVVKTFQRALLRAHDAVIFADADEFLVPRGESLKDFCQTFLKSERRYVRAMGFGVIHQIDSEKSFVPDDPLNDRSSMWRAPMYDKTLLSKDKLNWSKGHHAIYQDNTKLVDDPRDPELCLLHLRDVDINKFYERCLDRSKMKAANNASFHGSTDLEQVRTYFRTRMMPWQPLADSEYEGDALRVPDLWKKLINTKV